MSSKAFPSPQEGPHSRQPPATDFQQQRLRAWQPLLTPKWVVTIFAVVGAIFLIIGGIIMGTTNSVVEYEQRYDTSPLRQSATVSFSLTSDMSGPVYVYYKLTNFYQNHRRYVKSRSDVQLQGSVLQTTGCDPLESNNEGMAYYPCGLIAASWFNDVLDGWYCKGAVNSNGVCMGTLVSLGNGSSSWTSNPLWQKDGISWSADRDAKFTSVNLKPYLPPNNTQPAITQMGANNYSLPLDVTNEDFIVWMRTAGLPTFKKLYRIINMDFSAGQTIIIDSSNVFDVSQFNGEKSIVISNASWLGTQNPFLGWAYIATGLFAFVVALLFFGKQLVNPRPLGDLNYYMKMQQQKS